MWSSHARGGRASRPLPGTPVVVPTRLYEAYILDLDGTIYLGHDLLPGAGRLVEELRARNKRALDLAGIRMSEDPSKIDIVIASYDRGFDHRKLQIAFDAIWYYKRARLVAQDRGCHQHWRTKSEGRPAGGQRT
jgi:hypothetical protein